MFRMRDCWTAAVVVILSCIVTSSLSAGVPLATSTFGSNDEGWTVVTTLGYSGLPTYSATGGNPGGFIYGVDPDTGAWGFSAPIKFLNDKSDAYGQTFSFDIAAYNTPEGETAWVGLQGGGYEIVCPFDAPESVYPAWHSRSVTLIETAGWIDPITFEAPDYDKMIAILSDLDALVITAEFCDGLENDISGLDNVVLMPEPISLALLGCGSIALLARRKSR